MNKRINLYEKENGPDSGFLSASQAGPWGPDETEKTKLVCFGRDILGVKNIFLSIKIKSHSDGKIVQTVT